MSEFDNILREGWGNKRSRFFGIWRPRWLVLTPTHLYTFKEEKQYTYPTEQILLNSCFSIKPADEELNLSHSFCLDSRSRLFYFTLSSHSERESWLSQIGRAMIKASNKDSAQLEDYD